MTSHLPTCKTIHRRDGFDHLTKSVGSFLSQISSNQLAPRRQVLSLDQLLSRRRGILHHPQQLE